MTCKTTPFDAGESRVQFNLVLFVDYDSDDDDYETTDDDVSRARQVSEPQMWPRALSRAALSPRRRGSGLPHTPSPHISRQSSSADDSSSTDASDPNPKPKRDTTNPVVNESLRLKKLAKGFANTSPDPRRPVPELCPMCQRRFCRCSMKALEPPRKPLESDCCRSEPRCTFCVFVVYEDMLAEYNDAVNHKAPIG